MSKILIRNIEIIDAGSPYHRKKMDIEIIRGQIKNIKKKISIDAAGYREIDGKGKMISRSWTDMFGDVFTPGFEYRETMETGISSALAGGFGTVVMTPNHHPEVYLASHIQQLQRSVQNTPLNIRFLGAVTKKIEGRELSEMYDMYRSGAVAFSDGWSPVQNELLLSQALEYVKSFDGLIIHIPVNKNLNAGGLMNESEQSVAFGISGQPAIAEDINIYNVLSLAQYHDSHIHITGVSTAKGLDTIRTFKKKKAKVTCSVTPFHLLYNDSALEKYESIYKVTPPLRSEKDRKALIKGIQDGTVDAIASFNKPLNWDEKNREFEYAESGMASIQYVWPMLLRAAPEVSIDKWIELLADRPAGILKTETAGIDVNSKGTFTIFDTITPVNIRDQHSQAYNLPPVNENYTGYTQVI